MIDYVQVSVEVGQTEFVEVLIAELGTIGYDTFEETDDGFKAYIPVSDFSQSETESALAAYSEMTAIGFTIENIAAQNWNAEWEKNFPPVIVDNQVYIRASFHPEMPEVPYEIVINPKMSFGTGHHATTSLMVGHQLTLNHVGKRVLDAGTGTGILAIMAEKLGATEVFAYDIDPWPVENTIENLGLNGCCKTKVWQGIASDFKTFEPFDIVLANINRNVLLDEMQYYYDFMLPDADLLLSGFYEEDLEMLKNAAKNVGLSFVMSKVSPERWSLLHFQKLP
jgi:ribosomal protein L11 methyltransferase